jgi:hypothetical protein
MLRLYLYARVRVLMRKLHTRPRVQRAPGLPCALLSSRAARLTANLGQACREKANVYPRVIASAAKQSIFPTSPYGLLRGACHPAALRADRVARNDGEKAGVPWASDLSAVARRAKADTRDRLDHPHVAPLMRATFLAALLKTAPEQSDVTMSLSRMRMIGQHSNYFLSTRSD